MAHVGPCTQPRPAHPPKAAPLKRPPSPRCIAAVGAIGAQCDAQPPATLATACASPSNAQLLLHGARKASGVVDIERVAVDAGEVRPPKGASWPSAKGAWEMPCAWRAASVADHPHTPACLPHPTPQPRIIRPC